MDGPIPALEARAKACVERLENATSVALASHIDADGLASSAIAASALSRTGIDFETTFAKQLDEAAIGRIAESDHDVALFTDFGSGQVDSIAEHTDAGDFKPVVADHHRPGDAEIDCHLNPLLVGLDGATELSGAGTTYVLARALAGSDERAEATSENATGEHRDGTNRDLAALAVVGAVGDMQDSGGELVGANGEIVAEGTAVGVIEAATDLALYGRQTRALPKLLAYANELSIPGLSDRREAARFLSGLDADLQEGGEWRCWVDLDDGERRVLVSGLIRKAIERGVPAERIERLVGTSYTLLAETPGTELRDAGEFSTLLNATARYDRADVGLAVCLGNRERALTEARRLLAEHRSNLASGVEQVRKEGTEVEENLQWFDAGGRIRETIVGIVAGMALGGDLSKAIPIVAFAHAENGSAANTGTETNTGTENRIASNPPRLGEVGAGRADSGANAEEGAEETKVSARGTARLVRQGLDLSAVMETASEAVGGAGGGHDVAAGATIPRGHEEEFLVCADELIGEQLDG